MPALAVLLVRVAVALRLVCRVVAPEPAMVIGLVAYLDGRPLDAAALLVGVGCHETRFATVRQAHGGPARSWWQLEPSGPTRIARLVQAELWERDAFGAAVESLRIARGGLRGYACGAPGCGGERGAQAEQELRAAVTSARWALR